MRGKVLNETALAWPEYAHTRMYLNPLIPDVVVLESLTIGCIYDGNVLSNKVSPISFAAGVSKDAQNVVSFAVVIVQLNVEFAQLGP